MPGRRSYKAVLDEAWAQHLAPKAADAPTVVSTFAGCGGSSLGYSMAGYRELLAVEWDDNAVATFRRNFPEVPVYHGDIAKLSVERCLELAGLEPGQLDVFDGSPPCQGFSTAGKRILDDERNGLFREFVRLLRGLRPRAFVMENVSGMVKGKMRLAFVEILRELKASGYRVVARLLNAKYFFVPQSRERLIFVGVREDLGLEPSHPKAETGPISFGAAASAVSTVGDQHRTPSDRVLCYAPHHNGGWNTDPRILRSLTGADHSAAALKWASPSRVSGTVSKSEIMDGGIMHPSRKRYLSMNELKAVGSFDQRFDMINRKNAVLRIGNSVPPLFMRAIARNLRARILDVDDANRSALE